MEYKDLMTLREQSFFIADPRCSVRYVPSGYEAFPQWKNPISEDVFDRFARCYLERIDLKINKPFINNNDLMVVEMLKGMTTEVLMSSEEFMKQFKLSYIFLWNLRK